MQIQDSVERRSASAPPWLNVEPLDIEYTRPNVLPTPQVYRLAHTYNQCSGVPGYTQIMTPRGRLGQKSFIRYG